MAMLIIAIVIVAGLAAFLFELPQTIRCRFVLTPVSGADPVQAPRRGVVVARHAEEGVPVEAGEVLYELRADEVRPLTAERDSLRQAVPLREARLTSAEAQLRSRAEADAAEHQRLGRQLRELGDDLQRMRGVHELARAAAASTVIGAEADVAALVTERDRRLAMVTSYQSLVQRTRQLVAEGLRSQDALDREQVLWESARAEQAETERFLTGARTALDELQARHALEEAERLRAVAAVEAEIADLAATRAREEHAAAARARELEAARDEEKLALESARVRLESLERELEGVVGEIVRVRAPFAGSVVKLGPRQIGAVVERGSILCELARATGEGGALRAEVQVPPGQAGEVFDGQPVRLLFDAFPHTRYGVKRGAVSWVSAAATPETGAFRGYCTLEDQAITVQGRPVPFRAGMRGEARIVTGHRTLFELALEPLRELAAEVRD
jgi:membrane fusion protein